MKWVIFIARDQSFFFKKNTLTTVSYETVVCIPLCFLCVKVFIYGCAPAAVSFDSYISIVLLVLSSVIFGNVGKTVMHEVEKAKK